MNGVNNPLESLLSPSGKHVGDFVGWELSGSFNQEEVQRLASDHGLADDLKLPRTGALNAYKRAVNQCVKGSKDVRRFEVRHVETTAQWVVHAVCENTVEEGDHGTVTDKVAKSDTLFRVAFDMEAYKATTPADRLLHIEDEGHPVAVRLRQLYEEICVVYQHDQVRVAMQRAFEKWRAFRVISSGGWWFVPAYQAQKVRDWANFMRALGQKPVVSPVRDDRETIAALKSSSEDTLENQVENLIAELVKFNERGSVRASTLETKVEEFDELRARAELYSQMFGAKANEILDKVKATQQGLVQMIAAIS